MRLSSLPPSKRAISRARTCLSMGACWPNVIIYAHMIGIPRVISAPAQRVILGEGPVWDERTQTLYWVDIERGELHRCNFDGSNAHVTRIGERLGCIAL